MTEIRNPAKYRASVEKRLIDSVRNAEEGQRHHTLLYAVGELVRQYPALSLEYHLRIFTDPAIENGLPAAEVKSTIYGRYNYNNTISPIKDVVRLPRQDEPIVWDNWQGYEYVEIGRYDNNFREPDLIHVDAVHNYSLRHGNKGIYTSINHYKSSSIDSEHIGNLCFDFDSSSLDVARTETLRLLNHLVPNHLPTAKVYFSGGKGFHIEVKPMAVKGDYKFFAEYLKKELALKSLDIRIYDDRRMWRLVNSQHQKTGLYKVECKALLNGPLDNILMHAQSPQTKIAAQNTFTKMNAFLFNR